MIGGYGQVGRNVCLELAKAVPGRVVAAGRDLEKAEAFAKTTDGAVLSREVDISRDADEGLFDDARLVVVCVPQENSAFVESCLNTGTHYVDITELYSFLSLVEPFDDLARSRGATALLSVGLSPGLTNLLVKHCVSQLDTAKQAEIYLMVGDGNEHGDTLNELMLDHLAKDIMIPKDGSIERHRPFSDGKQTTFPDHLGRRRAYRFEFPEPYVLPRTLGLERVSHRTCTDSRFSTWIMHALSSVRFFTLLRFPFVKVAMRKMMAATSGSDVIAIKVIVSGERGGEPVTLEAAATGRDVNVSTGRFAAIIAAEIYSGQYQAGSTMQRRCSNSLTSNREWKRTYASFSDKQCDQGSSGPGIDTMNVHDPRYQLNVANHCLVVMGGSSLRTGRLQSRLPFGMSPGSASRRVVQASVGLGAGWPLCRARSRAASRDRPASLAVSWHPSRDGPSGRRSPRAGYRWSAARRGRRIRGPSEARSQERVAHLGEGEHPACQLSRAVDLVDNAPHAFDRGDPVSLGRLLLEVAAHLVDPELSEGEQPRRDRCVGRLAVDDPEVDVQ